MFTLFQSTSKNSKKITFEDIQYAIKHKDDFIIINTLSVTEQNCLILNTIPYDTEERVMNELLNNYTTKEKRIIIYGKNTNDDTVEKKQNQIRGLGFTEVYVYMGGMFEWMLLQDIYGHSEFPTTSKVLDILKYRGKKIFIPN
jgi:hypothetical protein